MALIKHQQLVADPWYRLQEQASPRPLDDHAILIPWSDFEATPEEWLSRTSPIGVEVPGSIDPELLGPYLDRLALIAVNFPKFTDGRGYSLARLLRSRFAYQGELRATGDIMRDQLLFLSRCGFDAFDLKAGKDSVGALEAFTELAVRYQPCGDGAVPPWKRRPARA